MRTVKSIRQQVASLSGGQRQTVAIARSVIWNSKVVILDEPTAALGVAQTEQVLKLVRRLADNGLAVVLISHNLNDVFEVADHIAVLYLGQMAAQVRTADVTRNQVVELITGGRSELDRAERRRPARGRARRARPPTAATGGRRMTATEPPSTAGRRPRPRRAARRQRSATTSPGSAAATSARCRPCSAWSCWSSCSRSCGPPTFTNAFNFANLIHQSAAVIVIAMGLVFVLLLGEIDLSAGYTAGTAAAVMGDRRRPGTDSPGRSRSSPASPPAR